MTLVLAVIVVVAFGEIAGWAWAAGLLFMLILVMCVQPRRHLRQVFARAQLPEAHRLDSN